VIALAVNGASGRMGRAIASLVRAQPDLRLAGGIDASPLPEDEAALLGYPRIVTPALAAEVIGDAQVVLDFSSPRGLAALLEDHGTALGGRALLVGTTGLGEIERNLLRVAERDVAVLQAANFSVGVNLLLRLVEEAARALPADRYDVEIVETHHRRKADAPSGTALELGRAVAVGRGMVLDQVRRDGRTGAVGSRQRGEIAFHAVRGGGVVGEHTVLFLGERERIELSHAASDRDLLAEGALLAARWLAGKAPGRYTMTQVLG
jgi:4-hydroxy-tetrahydrodipicolinate reductase